MKNKKEIRDYVKIKRNELKLEEKNKFDKRIFNKLIESEDYSKAKNIFIYVSFEGEVDTYRIIKHAFKNHKRVYVPKVISKELGMKAVEIKTLKDLKIGAYGIYEPDSFDNAVDENIIELVIVPGVAFDLSGGRVGYGGGFYDRFLKKLSPNAAKFALAYDFQLMNEVVMKEHDIRVDRIITN
ncbi:5-formyltetrahydrofolate cyclo-ligase [Clostridium brassicae]|uniref:5-formyltetrahydrofolate cyclo-ligase n=1 Tax=Clostridium brassicae TaxID=2999072 RepID=A0ABT4D5W6_9CLOT|nr:5-formyltetrahydrofolate cyclo-ligase [Clostridium brassicae]MCY6957682.1 5-formyltetrahydrofolate cyclo-ligase [Clostridium brassicae]